MFAASAAAFRPSCFHLLAAVGKTLLQALSVANCHKPSKGWQSRLQSQRVHIHIYVWFDTFCETNWFPPWATHNPLEERVAFSRKNTGSRKDQRWIILRFNAQVHKLFFFFRVCAFRHLHNIFRKRHLIIHKLLISSPKRCGVAPLFRMNSHFSRLNCSGHASIFKIAVVFVALVFLLFLFFCTAVLGASGMH